MSQLIKYLTFFLLLSVQFLFSKDDNGLPILLTNAEIINEHTTRIPFKLVDHLMLIEGTLHDKTGNFIIDTGSENMFRRRRKDVGIQA